MQDFFFSELEGPVVDAGLGARSGLAALVQRAHVAEEVGLDGRLRREWGGGGQHARLGETRDRVSPLLVGSHETENSKPPSSIPGA